MSYIEENRARIKLSLAASLLRILLKALAKEGIKPIFIMTQKLSRMKEVRLLITNKKAIIINLNR